MLCKAFNERALNSDLLKTDWPVATASILVTYALGMSKQVSPAPTNPQDCGGIQVIEGYDHNVHFFAAPTGTAFIFVTDPATTVLSEVFEECYAAFVEHVLRHPLYPLDSSGAGQHINPSKFDVFAARLDAVARTVR